MKVGKEVKWKDRVLEICKKDREKGAASVNQIRQAPGRRRPRKKGEVVVWKSWRRVSWKRTPGLIRSVRVLTLGGGGGRFC